MSDLTECLVCPPLHCYSFRYYWLLYHHHTVRYLSSDLIVGAGWFLFGLLFDFGVGQSLGLDSWGHSVRLAGPEPGVHFDVQIQARQIRCYTIREHWHNQNLDELAERYQIEAEQKEHWDKMGLLVNHLHEDPVGHCY